VGFAKLYDRKTSLTAADLLNDQVVPFCDAHEVPLSRILTNRGTEYCGSPDSHEYELYLGVSKTQPRLFPIFGSQSGRERLSSHRRLR
jgi:hypothetical protein